MSEYHSQEPTPRFSRFIFLLHRVHPGIAAALVALGLATVAGLDWLTGPEYSFSLFYYLCIAFGALMLGRWPSLVLGLVTAALATWVGIISGRSYASDFALCWTICIRVINFTIFALLLTQLRRLVIELREQSLRDPLTQAANRRYFDEYLARLIRASKRQAESLTIALFDIDDFKDINDRLGHQTGDNVLQAIVEAIHSQIRPEDILARLGGDEFVLVLRSTDYDRARLALPRIFGAVQTSFLGWESPVKLSIGALSYEKTPAEAATIMSQADAAMYEVKKSGKGQMRHQRA